LLLGGSGDCFAHGDEATEATLFGKDSAAVIARTLRHQREEALRAEEAAEEEARKMGKAKANETEAETEAETGTDDIIRSGFTAEFDDWVDPPTPAGPPDVASLPLFCLPNVYLFPRDTVAFNIFEPRYRLMVQEYLQSGQTFGIVSTAPEGTAMSPSGVPLDMEFVDELTSEQREQNSAFETFEAAGDEAGVPKQDMSTEGAGEGGGWDMEEGTRLASQRAPDDPYGDFSGTLQSPLVGITARIARVVHMEDSGRCMVMVQGSQRFSVRRSSVRPRKGKRVLCRIVCSRSSVITRSITLQYNFMP
jgi:hypothetical protein